MIVWPGLRRSVSAIQRLFNSASFYAPLTHSLVLERGTGSPTFTRASDATVMGYGPTDNAVDGLKLLTVAANEARFVGARRISEGVWSNTFADGSLIPAATNTGYLAEGARTNLCLQSNAFTTTWTQNNAAPTQNAIGPDGATSAWTLTDSSAVAKTYVTQAITLTAAPHTVSLKVKKTTGAQSSYPTIFALTGTGSIFSGVTVDTSNGVATPWTSFTGYTIASGVSVRCTSHNASFWQVEMTFTATAASWNFYLEPAGALTPTLATVGTDVSAQGSAVFYGAQVELGSFASTYIPTTTAAVTRAADVLTYPSAGNVSGTVGWCYAEYAHDNVASIANAELITVASARLPLYVQDANYTANAFDGTNGVGHLEGMVSGTTYKGATTWGGSTLLVAEGESATSGSFDGNFNTGATITLGAAVGNQAWFGTISNVRIGQRQLSASEMQAITR